MNETPSDPSQPFPLPSRTVTHTHRCSPLLSDDKGNVYEGAYILCSHGIKEGIIVKPLLTCISFMGKTVINKLRLQSAQMDCNLVSDASICAKTRGLQCHYENEPDASISASIGSIISL